MKTLQAPVDRQQEIQPGLAPRVPVLVDELLEQLGVLNAPFARQQEAIAGWFDAGNRPNRGLRLGLKRHRLLPSS